MKDPREKRHPGLTPKHNEFLLIPGYPPLYKHEKGPGTVNEWWDWCYQSRKTP